jgi:putative ABC transport system permease protein
MLYDLMIAWRNMRSRPVATAITMIVVGLTIGLSVTVAHLDDGLRRGIARASNAFGVLVVGAKGSGQQLVLSTVLLQGLPVGNIPATVYDRLRNDERVDLAIPIAMGDNVGGARIVGTNHDFFQLRASLNTPPAFRIVEGRLFEVNFEAVLGSTAARRLGLGVGDRFVPQHGVERGLEEDAHDVVHTVVGILEPGGSPYDNAVFTTVQSVIEIHREDEHGQDEHGEEEHAASEGELDPDDSITAVLVRPKGFIEANQLWQEFYTGTEAQAAFPGAELAGLFALLNQGQRLLNIVGYLAAIMAALTLFLAIYSAASAREQWIAVMRGVGAGQINIFRMVLLEAVLVALCGALVGRIAGYAVAWIIAGQIAQESAIPIPIRYLPQLEVWLWLLPLGLGVAAGLLPAIQAYRVSVVEKLFPT